MARIGIDQKHLNRHFSSRRNADVLVRVSKFSACAIVDISFLIHTRFLSKSTFLWACSSQLWLVPLMGLTTQIKSLSLVFEILRIELHACLDKVLLSMLVKS